MKNKLIKTLFSLLAIFAVLAALTLPAFAEQNGALSGTDSDNAEVELVSCDSSDEDAEEGDGAVASSEKETDGEEQNFFAALYEGAREHLGEILCALTLVGSIFLAFAYKKGLLPIVTKALGAIGSSVGMLGEQTGTFASKIEEQSENLRASIGEIQSRLQGFEEALAKIKGGLDGATASGEILKQTERTLGEQVEMLYEIFMSSALPQYQKEAVAKRIADMRRENGEGEG